VRLGAWPPTWLDVFLYLKINDDDDDKSGASLLPKNRLDCSVRWPKILESSIRQMMFQAAKFLTLTDLAAFIVGGADEREEQLINEGRGLTNNEDDDEDNHDEREVLFAAFH